MAIRMVPDPDKTSERGIAQPDSQPARVVKPPERASKAKVGRPRLEDVAKTIEAKSPWKALGMSRASWFRRKAKGELT